MKKKMGIEWSFLLGFCPPDILEFHQIGPVKMNLPILVTREIPEVSGNKAMAWRQLLGLKCGAGV